jgi:hypothetical protein
LFYFILFFCPHGRVSASVRMLVPSTLTQRNFILFIYLFSVRTNSGRVRTDR